MLEDDPIGSGGTGTVWRGYDQRLRRPVGICAKLVPRARKIIPSMDGGTESTPAEPSDEPSGSAAFEKERTGFLKDAMRLDDHADETRTTGAVAPPRGRDLVKAAA
ncbi:hypothetical protein GCM10009850_072450 [Nonomuraea monospora]|uniref:Uncharacterized protein n=1 Tax=Nonomuraea monospora TaxID=568818 RepID=A0ABN3CR17_9ACTN